MLYYTNLCGCKGNDFYAYMQTFAKKTKYFLARLRMSKKSSTFVAYFEIY
jgi:hypothetical protein